MAESLTRILKDLVTVNSEQIEQFKKTKNDWAIGYFKGKLDAYNNILEILSKETA